jgi:AcrR family transcriptional regulator
VVQRLSQAERRKDTRRRLLVSARVVFGQRGFGGASLDEIAEAAGLTRGALYYNFPGGKDDLFLALFEERTDERAAAIEQAFGEDAGGGLEATLSQSQAAAKDFAETLSANREFHRLFFEFALHASREGDFADRFKERETSIRRTLVKVIEERAEQLGGELPLPADELALGLIALGNGLALENVVEETNVPEGLYGRLIGFLLLGIVTAARDEASVEHHAGTQR